MPCTVAKRNIKPVKPKGSQPRILIGRTVADAGALKTDSLEKNLVLGRIEGKRRKEQSGG